MTKSYTPRADSLAAQVIGFFQRNPDEVLAIEDITEKFEVTRGNVHSLLALAVEANVIRRQQTDEGYEYSQGPAFKHLPPTPKSDASSSPGKRKRAPPVVIADIETLKIDTNVPVPQKQRGTDWNALLNRLAPGHSVELPRSVAVAASSAITARHKQSPQRFTLRTISDEHVRLWRVE
jgi:hypothetical protein